MKLELEPTCNPEDWSSLRPSEQLTLLLKASLDPIFFWSHPCLGNCPPWPSQAEILSDFNKLGDDGRRIYSELVMVSGMRGGKTSLAAMQSLWEAFKLIAMENPAKHYNLATGSEIQCINVAPSEPQSLDTIFKRSKELFANSPYFMSQKYDLVYNSIRFPKKNVTVKALGSNSSSGVGRTVKCFLADEVSSFLDNQSKRSASEIYSRLSKSTATFKPWNENIRVAISSPLYEGDFITELHRQSIQEKLPYVKTIWEPTWKLNPNLTLEILEEEKKRDPESFDRDFGAQPGSDHQNLFKPEAMKQLRVKFALGQNWFNEPPKDIRQTHDEFIPLLDIDKVVVADDAQFYFVGTDPSVKNDAYGFSIGHLTNDDRIVIDGSTVFIAARGSEISTPLIQQVTGPLFERLPIRFYNFDVYLHSELKSTADNYGISTVQHFLNINDYVTLRQDIYSDKTELPFSDYLFKEMAELIVIKNKTVDHPAKGSKDMIDSVTQVVSGIRTYQAIQKSSIPHSPFFFARTFSRG